MANTVPISYADIYNSAFVADNKEDWMYGIIHRTRLMPFSQQAQQIRIIRNLKTMLNTQDIMSRSKKDSMANVHTEANKLFEDIKRIRVHRTKRLVRRMLKHAYRPNGRMFQRIVDEEALVAHDTP